MSKGIWYKWEKDVLVSHGASKFLHEKFFKHSDGYTEYICRCGRPAIVNHKEGIYRCLVCKDNSDITAIPTSWTAKLFRQEIESCNVGVRPIPRPFTFETQDNEDRDLSSIDIYNEESLKQLAKFVEDSIDDNGVALDAEAE